MSNEERLDDAALDGVERFFAKGGYVFGVGVIRVTKDTIRRLTEENQALLAVCERYLAWEKGSYELLGEYDAIVRDMAAIVAMSKRQS
ncbi:MAG: hypothetical protein KGR26_07235 [Cyanobacteria bacterium REEB65]|nr:hypothetical protein [Cyanobacteria bacterium REEB65]